MLTAGIVSLALLIVAQLSTSGPKSTPITLTGEALGLAPGTSVDLQIGVERVFIDKGKIRPAHGAKEGFQSLPAEAITGGLAAPERYPWTFIVPDNGIVPNKEMAFEVPASGAGPSANTIEYLSVAVQFTITLPGRGKDPGRTISKSSQYSAPESKFRKGRCFRIQGFEDGSFTIGVVDCDEKMKHPREGIAPGN